MSALTSLLVRDHQVPVQRIEEAIQRQVISGGALDTVLLELDVLPENVRAAYCAAAVGMRPASREALESPTKELLQLVPREVAERHGIVPLSRERQVLVVAVAPPLDAEILERLTFLIGVELDQRIAAAARLARALQAHYGTEPAPRIRRLGAKLAARDPGPLAVVAPAASNLAVRTGHTDTYGRVPAPEEPSSLRRDTVRDTGGAASPEPTPTGGERPARAAQPTPAIPVSRSVAVGQPPTPSEPPASGGASRRRIAEPETEVLRRLRGPLTAERAAAMLADADDRDAILEIGFAFVRQFFDYTAAFVISDGRVEGLDGAGVDAVSFDALRRITLRLEEPSSFALASEGAVPLITHLDGSVADRRVRTMLGRAGKLPAIFLPIAIRGRVVLVLYGDRSGEAFGLADVPEPVAFTTRLGDAFQKLILRRKLRARDVDEDADAPASEPAEPSEDRIDAEIAMPETEGAPSASGPAPVMPTERVSSVPPTVPRSVVLGVLGVPRNAPPPPQEETRVAEEAFARATVDAGHARVVEEQVRSRKRDPRAEPTSDPSPAPEAEPPAETPSPEEAFPAPQAATTPGTQAAPEPERSEADVELEVAPLDTEELGAGMESIAPDPFAPAPDPRPPDPRPPDPRQEPGSVPPAGIEMVGAVAQQPQAVPAPDAPNVIVSLGDEFDAVVADVVLAGPDDESIVQRVLGHGEAVLPALVREFPGPLWFDRHRPFRRRPRGRDVSAIARCIVAFGERAAPYVVSLLDVREADARYYALLLAAELPHRSLVLPLGRRLFDEDGQVRDLAISVLRTLQRFPEEMSDLLERVRASAKVPRQTPERRAAAARALGELRDPLALDLLVQLLRARERTIALAAHAALVNLTRQDYGDDAPAWAAWVRNNADRHRIEWLIDALLHGDELMRTAAGDELKNLTQAYFGYHPALPRRDREIAQRKYRGWWQTEGRARFDR